MKRLWQRVSGFGVRAEVDEQEVRTIIFTNRIAFILGFFILSSVVINILLGTYAFVPALLGASFFLALCYFFNGIGRYFLAKTVVMLAGLSLLTYMVTHGGFGSGLEFYFISFTVLPAIIFRQKGVMLAFQALCVACLVYERVYYNAHFFPMRDPIIVYKVFFVVNSVYSTALVVLGILFFKNASSRHEGDLLKQNSTIEKKNLELERINRELSRTNHDLEQFAYVASHDLKEPLRMIASYSQLLTMRNTGDPDSEEFSGFILQGVSRMQQLINDLLVYSKVSHTDEHFKPVNTEKLVSQLQFFLKDEINRTNASIHYRDLPVVRGHESQLMQLFQNLLVNAMKFVKQGQPPVIHIGAEERQHDWLFSVSDNGIGIEHEYHEKIFVIFQRLHNQALYPGTGIGLAICKKIVEQHGGTIWLESVPGEGTTFYFILSKGVEEKFNSPSLEKAATIEA